MSIGQGVVAVTGLGMASSLGGVVMACAAARAGMQRVGPLSGFQVHDRDLFESVPAQGHFVRGITEGYQGAGRLLRLCSEALLDLFAYARLERDDINGAGLLLNLSNDFFRRAVEARERAAADRLRIPESGPVESEVRREGLRKRLLPRLCALNEVAFHPGFQRLYFESHAGVIRAVDEAITLLHERKLDVCIVGGVDSYLEPEVLRALHQLRVLKVPDQPVGLMPGEAAAFILLERYEHAARRGAAVEALIGAPGFGEEDTHRFSGEPPLGRALGDAIFQSLRRYELPAEEIGWLLGSLNGDDWRAREWGHVLTRLPRGLVHARSWSPAESFGELGAATTAVAICNAVRAFQRDYAKTRHVLLWASNEDGEKGALVVSAPPRSMQARRTRRKVP